jgi:hypothetical protein
VSPRHHRASPNRALRHGYRWTIEKTGPDTADVLRNGRQLRADVDVGTAMAYVRRQRSKADLVTLIEPDGRSQNITKKL